MNNAIDLQKRADEMAVMLRRDGYKDAASLILELRRELYERQSALDRIRWALDPD